MAVVVSVALMVNLIGLVGGPLMYQPDSGNYLVSAYMLWQHGSFAGVNLNRVPGYTLFLAPILGLGGAMAMPLMAGVQQCLAVATSAMIVRIGDLLDDRRVLGLVAGLLSAFSLQYQSYARLPMSEIPYGVLAVAGLWAFLVHLKSGGRKSMLVAVLLFSLATLMRPSAELLPWLIVFIALCRALLPGVWSRLFPQWPVPARRKGLVSAVFSVFVTTATLLPWCVHNLIETGYFGLTGTVGLNLYSNTVEYGGFLDENSAAIAEIKRHWDEFEAKQIAKGEPPETTYTWRNHWASMRHVMGNTGWPMWQADNLFKKAALDAIKAHPKTFARHVVKNTYITLVTTEPTYNYLAGLRQDEVPPDYIKYALSLDNMERVRAMHDGIISRGGMAPERTLRFGEANAITPVYGVLMTAYHSVVMYGNRMLMLLGVGCGIALLLALRGHSEWLVMLGFLAYVVLVPALVVPGAPRHRLPSDPAICLFYGLALVTMVRLIVARARFGLIGSATAEPRERFRILVTLAALVVAAALGMQVGGADGLMVTALALVALAL